MMTAPANNDRTSETPKTPEGEGYKTWLELVLGKLGDCYWSDTRISDEDISCARSELSALRAKAAAYQEAMRRIVSWSTFDPGKSMVRFINAEIEAGRFVP